MVLKDFWRIDQTEKKAESHSKHKQIQFQIEGHTSL